jgi:CDP-diacylglycerol---serine O-phosphatidyltransferase
MKRHIPNLLTLGNLVSGTVALILLADRPVETMGYIPGLLFLAAFFDLLDGAIARALGVSGDMGKQLDSLADVVSFGLVPTFIVYRMLESCLPPEWIFLRWIAVIHVCAAAYRLARFNISTDQTTDFLGMPSPAHGLFWASVALSMHERDWSVVLGYGTWTGVLLFLSVITAWLMVSKMRMFSFKFKPGGFAANRIPFIYVGLLPVVAVVGLLFLPGILTTLVVGILLYMALSGVYALQR